MLVFTNARSRRRGVNAGAVAQNVPGQQLIQARVKAPEAVVRLVQLAEQEGGAGAANTEHARLLHGSGPGVSLNIGVVSHDAGSNQRVESSFVNGSRHRCLGLGGSGCLGGGGSGGTAAGCQRKQQGQR